MKWVISLVEESVLTTTTDAEDSAENVKIAVEAMAKDLMTNVEVTATDVVDSAESVKIVMEAMEIDAQDSAENVKIVVEAMATNLVTNVEALKKAVHTPTVKIK